MTPTPVPRPHFAYVFERFPSYTQTFCAREVVELQRQGVRLLLFSIRSTAKEIVSHFPPELIEQVITLPPPDVLLSEVEAMKNRRELPQSIVMTLREWGTRPDKARIYEAAWIGQALRKAGVHHVHTHFAGLAARTSWWIRQFYGLSYSFTGHANDLFCPDEATELKLPRLIGDAAAVIAVSDFTANWLRERHPASTRRIHRVYNGLDLSPIMEATPCHFMPGGSGESKNPPPKASPPLIYTVGRLIEKKGFAVLIRACALLREAGTPFQCRITGEGPLRETLQAQIEDAQLGTQVTLTGPLSQPDIIGQLASATIFAFPCVTEAEGGRDVLPTVLMEAMAAALPCVSTPVAGVPEMVIHGQTGLLAPEQDPAATAAALSTLLRDPALAVRYGQAGLAITRQKFTQNTTARHLRLVLTAHCKVNGFPHSLPLAAAYLRQFFFRCSRTLRPRWREKSAIFP